MEIPDRPPLVAVLRIPVIDANLLSFQVLDMSPDEVFQDAMIIDADYAELTQVCYRFPCSLNTIIRAGRAVAAK